MRISFNDNHSKLYSDTPNFQSKIKFVSQDTINALKRNGEKIGFLADSINNVKAPKFYTEGVRTCTAGGLVIPHKEAVGFHYYDFSLRNFLNIN